MQRIFILNPKNTAVTINIKQSSVVALLTKIKKPARNEILNWENMYCEILEV